MTLAVDTAVLGSGPVALASALFRSRHGAVALAARPEAPAAGIERVPAALLTLLLELGIVPAELDVDRLTRARLVAWEAPSPVERPGPACAHLDRAALVAALWRRVAEQPAIHVVPPVVGSAEVALAGGGWVAERLVDATGRRALTAAARAHPIPVWVAACCTVPRQGADPTMQVAAGPTGYAYRLGSAHRLTVGWVSPQRPPHDGAGVTARIVAEGAGWLTDGVDLRGAIVTRRAASLAIARRPDDHRIQPLGEAALGRDALASQGAAIGLSDARLAAEPDEAAVLAERHRDGLDRHLRHLGGMLATCAHHDAPAWLAYRGWVERQRAAGQLTADDAPVASTSLAL